MTLLFLVLARCYGWQQVIILGGTENGYDFMFVALPGVTNIYVIYLYQQGNDEESDQPRDKGLVFCQNVLRLYPHLIPKTTSITCLQKGNFSNVSRLFLPS